MSQQINFLKIFFDFTYIISLMVIQKFGRNIPSKEMPNILNGILSPYLPKTYTYILHYISFSSHHLFCSYYFNQRFNWSFKEIYTIGGRLEDNSTQNCVISQLPYNWGLVFLHLQNYSAYDQASRSSSFDNKMIFPCPLILTTWILQMFWFRVCHILTCWLVPSIIIRRPSCNYESTNLMSGVKQRKCHMSQQINFLKIFFDFTSIISHMVIQKFGRNIPSKEMPNILNGILSPHLPRLLPILFTIFLFLNIIYFALITLTNVLTGALRKCNRRTFGG